VKIIARTASQVLTILTEATRKATFYRIVNQPLEILLSATRKASYHRTAEILIEIRQQLSLTKTPQLPPAQFVPAIPPIPPPTYSLHVHIVDLFGMNAPDLTVKIWRTSSESKLMATLKTDKNGLSEPVKLPAGKYSVEIYKDEKLQLQQVITLNEDATLEIQIGIPVVITFDIITLAIIATTLILALIYITKRSKR
jgi:5-hydroxyisourate hydrolase-like protein (transthyretin family)